MNRLLIKSGPEKGLSLELQAGVNRLGRNPENDLVIEDPTISGTHCELELVDGSLLVRDLQSTNGTFVNGQKIQEAQLAAGQKVTVGDIELSFETNPVVVAIPEFSFAEKTTPDPLPDGSVACHNHAQHPATHKCTQCQRTYCRACLHNLRVMGSQMLLLCPVCSGRCELLPGFAIVKRKKSLFARLRETLRLG